MEISRPLPADLQFQISTAIDSATKGTQQLINTGGIASVDNALEVFSTKDASYNLNFDAKQLPAVQQAGAYSHPGSANLSPDVAKLVRDPNFQVSDGLLNCANNFFGAAGITEKLTGSNGLLNDLIGGWKSGKDTAVTDFPIQNDASNATDSYTPELADPILFPTDPLRADLKFNTADPILFPTDPTRADLKFNTADPILFPNDPTRADLKFNTAEPILFPNDPLREDLKFDNLRSATTFGGIDQTIQQLRSEGTVADPILYPVDPIMPHDTSKTEPPQSFNLFTQQLHSLQEMETSVKDLANLVFQVNQNRL